MFRKTQAHYGSLPHAHILLVLMYVAELREKLFVGCIYFSTSIRLHVLLKYRWIQTIWCQYVRTFLMSSLGYHFSLSLFLRFSYLYIFRIIIRRRKYPYIIYLCTCCWPCLRSIKDRNKIVLSFGLSTFFSPSLVYLLHDNISFDFYRKIPRERGKGAWAFNVQSIFSTEKNMYCLRKGEACM